MEFHFYNWQMEVKHQEFQITYIDITPKNILILEKWKLRRHSSFLNIFSREKGLFVFYPVSVGVSGSKEWNCKYPCSAVIVSKNCHFLGYLLSRSALQLVFILMVMMTVSHSQLKTCSCCEAFHFWLWLNHMCILSLYFIDGMVAKCNRENYICSGEKQNNTWPLQKLPLVPILVLLYFLYELQNNFSG